MLNSTNGAFPDTTSLFDYGFDNFEKVDLNVVRTKNMFFLSKYAIYPLVQKKKMVYHMVNQEAEERSYRI